MKTIAEKIKELRKESKITQQQLAKFINVGQSTIVGWEKGEYEPTASNIKMLAIFFNVTADFLIGLEDETGAKYINSFNGAQINASDHGNIKF